MLDLLVHLYFPGFMIMNKIHKYDTFLHSGLPLQPLRIILGRKSEKMTQKKKIIVSFKYKKKRNGSETQH